MNVFRVSRICTCKRSGNAMRHAWEEVVDLPVAQKGSGFSLHFEVLMVEMDRQMPVSAFARIVGIEEDSVWRILMQCVNHKVEEE